MSSPRALLVVLLTALLSGVLVADPARADTADGLPTTTPIKHLIVLFQENQSFDHYFGTYPTASNQVGEIPFAAAAGTPTVNGLSGPLLTANANAFNPYRVAPADMLKVLPCDNNHAYTAEQNAMHAGAMDEFVQSTQGGGDACQPGAVMSYYDGNTVTALWNYAQRFAMSDAQYGTTFGPSTVGAINLVSGTTRHPVNADGTAIGDTPGVVAGDAAISNRNPPTTYDGCSGGTPYAFDDNAGNHGAGTHLNIGDQLNSAGVTWGWFQAGFTPTSRQAPDLTYPHGRPVCASTTKNAAGNAVTDYDPHHNPFAYFKSTANPEHLAPTGAVGTTDQANHQYDTSYLFAGIQNGDLPAVSFVKAPAARDGHPGYSDPVSEQRWLVDVVNAVQGSSLWANTAVLIAWDDSDGWYDHAVPPAARSSNTSADTLNGAGNCNVATAPTLSAGRCGFGPRLPLLAISPYAKRNSVDHTTTDQTSILRFVEDNWSTARIGGDSADASAGSLSGMFNFAAPSLEKLTLDPSTGAAPGTSLIAAPASLSAPATPTPAPTATPTPAPGTGLGRVTCMLKRTGAKSIKALCKAAHAPSSATTVTGSLGLKVSKGGTKAKGPLATKTLTVTSNAFSLVLAAKKKLPKAAYTVRLAFTPSFPDTTSPLAFSKKL